MNHSPDKLILIVGGIVALVVGVLTITQPQPDCLLIDGTSICLEEVKD
jgi:hypothetical protein